jgi:hypothetical protein
MHSTSPPYMLLFVPISSFLTCSFQLYSAKNTSYEAAHYAVFSRASCHFIPYRYRYSPQHPILSNTFRLCDCKAVRRWCITLGIAGFLTLAIVPYSEKR